MPGLCSLGAHAALQEVQAGMRDGEAVFAFLNDVYVVALPDRIPAEGADERGINCELLPMPQGQPVADNLDAPGLLHGHIQIHISQAHIPGHMCASLAASARSREMAREARTPAVAHTAW